VTGLLEWRNRNQRLRWLTPSAAAHQVAQARAQGGEIGGAVTLGTVKNNQQVFAFGRAAAKKASN